MSLPDQRKSPLRYTSMEPLASSVSHRKQVAGLASKFVSPM